MRPSCSVLIASQRSRTRPGESAVGVAEDVRMAANELRMHRPRDRLEVTHALLVEEQGEEVRLEQEVAQLVEQLRGSSPALAASATS